jgi:uncharacterized membrane protein YphA (DoxX/SURF4 family)
MGMKNIFVAFFALLLPSVALAHTKWFAEESLSPFSSTEPTALYLSAWVLIIVLVVAIGMFVEKKRWFNFGFLQPKKPHVFERAASTFAMVTGTFFIIAGTHEYLFSPNLSPESGVPMSLIFIQIAIGFAFLLGIASRLAAIALSLLWCSLFIYIEPILVIENVWVLSTALFITLMGNEYFSIVSFASLRSLAAPYKKYALSILRVGTGATLMILGLSEKILAPEFGVNFLSSHHWNFMHQLGFTYSDYLFTLSAGAVEFLFGLIFVLGIATRLNALVVAVVFSIPLFILGPVELAGHLPHFAAVVLLLLFGGGGHFSVFGDKKYR